MPNCYRLAVSKCNVNDHVGTECFPHLSFRCGLQVAQTVAEPLGSQAELPMLLLDGGHTLEHHLIILPRGKRVKMAVSTKALIGQLDKCFTCVYCASLMSQTKKPQWNQKFSSFISAVYWFFRDNWVFTTFSNDLETKSLKLTGIG